MLEITIFNPFEFNILEIKYLNEDSVFVTHDRFFYLCASTESKDCFFDIIEEKEFTIGTSPPIETRELSYTFNIQFLFNLCPCHKTFRVVMDSQLAPRLADTFMN